MGPRLLLLLALLTACTQPSPVARKLERDYQRAWCEQMQGKAEVTLPDGARVDCLTDEYAIEVDYAKKWAEAVGQSLYYAQQTGKRPGVLLIVNLPADQPHLDRLNQLADKYQITTWTTPVAHQNAHQNPPKNAERGPAN